MDVDSLTEKMVVALDFGTSQVGFAHVLASCPSEITVCEDLQRRIPDLYYELQRGTLSLRSYGQKAQDDICNSLSAVSQYVSKLKLHVAVDNVEPELKLHLPEGLTVDDVISDCLREYGQFILQQLREKFDKKFEFHHIQWCLLVPSFWGENAKLRMKACMINAGLLKGASNVDGSPYPLVTVLAVEAASLAFARSLSLHQGRFLVASIGGGTLDMVTVERIGEAEMHDMLESSMGGGGYCGSFCLDLNFLALLSMKMGAWISEFLKQNPSELNNLMLQWEQIKMEFPNGSELTLHFLETIQNSWESFERTSTFGQIRESYKSLQLTIDDVKMVFEPVVQTILELIASQLARANHVNALVLVGGFAESPYLLEHIKHRFCDQVEVKPAESKLAVLKGAVSFALHPKEIRSRIVRKTYGLGMSMDFQAGLYSSEEEINEVERFRIDVKKGSRVEVDFCESSVHRPLHFGQKDMKFSLYSSVESYPRYTNEESVTKEWDFVVDISGSVNLEEKPQIRIDLYYGRSAIEVEARAVNFGDDCNPLPVRFVVGSVYERNTMVTNVAKKSYGIGAHKSLAIWDLPEYQLKRVDEEDLCNFSIESVIRKGTQLDHFASRTIYPIYCKQPILVFKLYSSSETSTVYTTDDTVVEEGVLEIDISKGLYLDMDRKVSARMWFSRTEIKISSVALNFAKPEERNLPIRLRNGRWENQVTLNLARHLRVVPPQSEALPELQTDTRVPIDYMDEDMEEGMEEEEDMDEDMNAEWRHKEKCMETLPELQVIENVRKISGTVWVNKNQCERIAVRFTLIAERLKVMELDKDFPRGKTLDGGSSSMDYPAFDELLTVLRKGEALVSSYGNDGVWKVITRAISRTDNREAFLEIHLELDTLNSQFHFEGFNGKYVELASGVDRSDLLTEDAEKDSKALPKNVEKLTRINPQICSNLDLETLQQVVTEKIKPVGDGKLPSYLKIDLATIEIEAPIRELVRQSKQDPTDRDGWALVCYCSWLGCGFAIKVFKSGDQSEWNKGQLLKEVGALVELRHPHVIRLVGFGQDSKQSFFLMEMMDADLRNFMKKKLEPAPKPKPRPFNRSEELDIITQIAKGMYYLHTQQYVHGDLKCTNILVKESGGYLEVKIADFGNAMKLGGDWDQAAFDIACSTRQPRWTAPKAIKRFGGTRPSSESLLKSDVYCFAMTCYEVVTGKYPFDGIRADALLEQIEAGVRPELPGELGCDLGGVIASCWDPDPNKRPSYQSICHVLDYIRSKQSAVGINKSSGKDLVLRLFMRIPQLHGPIVGPLGQVRKNANPPAIESSTWDDQEKAHELQLSNCNVSFGEHLRIKPSDLKILKYIGSDAYTKVYEATWLGCTFAVKRFKSQNVDIRDLTQELQFLISLRHPYVAQLVGLSVGDQECMIVMELMSSNLRDLIECLQRKRKTRDTSSAPFDLHEAVLIIWKIALGMAFLHSREVMHRDLKSLNVLVQEHPGRIDVKIVDFGLSRYLTKSETRGAYLGVDTGFWRAPEILPTKTADRSSKRKLRAIDVYAFAMTSYEVVTGRIPCSEFKRVEYDPVIRGYRPTLPSDLHPDLKALTEQCWDGEPEKRPDFTLICEELRRIQQALSNSTS